MDTEIHTSPGGASSTNSEVTSTFSAASMIVTGTSLRSGVQSSEIDTYDFREPAALRAKLETPHRLVFIELDWLTSSD